MAGSDEQNIRDALGPDLARRTIGITADGAMIRLILDVAGLPADQRDALENAARTSLQPILNGRVLKIALTADRASATPAPRIIAVASGKGGVGKSTVAANLAVALHAAGRKVGLVDADIYGPSQARLLSAPGRPTATEKKLNPVPSRFGVPVLSMAQLVEPDKAIAWRGPMTGGALGQLIDAEWGDVRELVVDLPPGTGDVQLTMVQKHKPAGAVIVSTPQDLALIDATRAIQLFEVAQVPIIGLVENMAGYVCPHCGERSDPFGEGGAEAAAQRLGIPFLGRIPLDIDIRVASDAGVPPATARGGNAEPFHAIAGQVASWLDAKA